MTAKEIREAQKNMGFSTTKMAEELGVARGTYDKWQRGEQKAPAVAIQAIKMLMFIHFRGLLKQFHDFCKCVFIRN